MADLALTPEILAARGKWTYRGASRPAFAESTATGEESVWDFPRPPRMEAVQQSLSVMLDGGGPVARTHSGVRVLETAGAPTYYFPPGDVDETVLTREAGTSVCEWKGVAVSFSVGNLPHRAWRYEQTFSEFAAIRNWYAFYPLELLCYVGDEQAEPQPGGYYGGWVTSRLRGPIKGLPGSNSW